MCFHVPSLYGMSSTYTCIYSVFLGFKVLYVCLLDCVLLYALGVLSLCVRVGHLQGFIESPGSTASCVGISKVHQNQPQRKYNSKYFSWGGGGGMPPEPAYLCLLSVSLPKPQNPV